MKTVQLSMFKPPVFYIDIGKSKRLLRAFVDEYNEGKLLRDQIRANHLALVVELLEIYRVVVWRVQAPPLTPPHGGGEPLRPGAPLPYLATNNVQLGQLMLCSERSIQNYRCRLKAAGLIVQEVWHGSNASYELRLNPAIIHLARQGDSGNHIHLFGRLHGGRRTVDGARRDGMWKTGAKAVDKGGKRQRKQGRSSSLYGERIGQYAENFSPYCNQLQQVTNKLNQLEVGKCGNRAGTGELPVRDVLRGRGTGYETVSDTPPLSLRDISPDGEKPPRVARRPPAGGDGKAGRWREKPPLSQSDISPEGGERLPGRFSEVVAGLPEKLGRRIFREVTRVWEVAREELYAGEWIADAEWERAKARLAEYYVEAHPDRYEAGTAEICERIRLVRKWIDRGQAAGEPERWVPIPSVYFDWRNERGFRRTKGWYKRHMAKRKEIGDRVAVAKAVQRFKGCKENSDGESLVAVFREIEGRLSERGEHVVKLFWNVVEC